MEELQALTQELGISDDVKFFGTIPNAEVAHALQTLDIFVNCSVKESFGVAIVEAMACGLPIVATDTAGFREVVDNGITGYILEDREPETMAKRIIELLNNSELRNQMGSEGRKKVLELYDWGKNISIMENLYKRLCGEIE